MIKKIKKEKKEKKEKKNDRKAEDDQKRLYLVRATGFPSHSPSCPPGPASHPLCPFSSISPRCVPMMLPPPIGPMMGVAYSCPRCAQTTSLEQGCSSASVPPPPSPTSPPPHPRVINLGCCPFCRDVSVMAALSRSNQCSHAQPGKVSTNTPE